MPGGFGSQGVKLMRTLGQADEPLHEIDWKA